MLKFNNYLYDRSEIHNLPVNAKFNISIIFPSAEGVDLSSLI